MGAGIRKLTLCVAVPLLAAAAGCGNYRVTFEVADVINAWGDDVTREALAVDILCLSKSDVENHPQIVQGGMRSAEWFRARDQNNPGIADIDPDRIYALRWGDAEARRDTLMGQPLASAMDREDGRTTTVVPVSHPGNWAGESAIVIYGRFTSREGLAPVPPLVLQPPPKWKSDIRVRVGRRGMSLEE